MTGNVYHFKAIGNIAFVKNNRAKTLRITVRPKGGVRVTVPRYVSMENAFRFVEEKTDWIRKSLEKVKPFEEIPLIRPGVNFQTRNHKVEFVWQPEGKVKAKVGNGLIQLFYTHEDDVLTAYAQQFICKAIEFAIRAEAKQYLPGRVASLAARYGFSYAGLRLKNLKSRWGSCSSTNNINLNIQLIRLPDHLIDYVILHELIHTIHKNHGPGFWLALDKITGNARQLAKEMKKYRTQFY